MEGITTKELESIVEKATDAWSSIANIRFTKTRGDAHIVISLQPKQHKADTEPREVNFHHSEHAHALLPCGKSDKLRFIHLWDKWNWSIRLGGGKSILDTVAHEIGHTLGLLHSSNSEDLMYSFTRQNIDFNSVTFSKADKENIEAIYGPPEKGELFFKLTRNIFIYIF